MTIFCSLFYFPNLGLFDVVFAAAYSRICNGYTTGKIYVISGESTNQVGYSHTVRNLVSGGNYTNATLFLFHLH